MLKGKISIETENIFPIIKQFLYTDQEIFLRELIANAIDATQKIKTLHSKGVFSGDLGNLKLDIVLDEEKKLIKIIDRGIGMTKDEVQKYLNQVAFSSAQEFIEKYKEDANIIGHFGLGFYSAFMVADKVEVVTKSYQENTEAVTWSCTGDPEYTIDDSDKTERGTEIILHISDDSDEFLNKERIEGLLSKYCKFLPIEIQFGTKEEIEFEGEGEDKKEIKTEVANIVNNPNPAWKKSPSELTDEDYINFYKELYPFAEAPLFWIHLNIDYPFNLTGILYFPKITNNIEVQKDKIHLYSNQVYVTDDVKDIVPEFLTLLHGVIDSPDIPLNVSRSGLQSDRNVRKITSYITKKVADKLVDLYKNEKENYESKWTDISVFVKYGLLSDEKFYDKAIKACLLTNTEGEHLTIEDYIEKIKPLQTNKDGKVIALYTNDIVGQDSFVNAAKDKSYDVLVMDNVIDNHFIQQMEQKNTDVSYKRVDADIVDELIAKDEKKESILSEKEEEKVKAIFEVISKASSAQLSLKPMSEKEAPVMLTKPEFMRRMMDMQALQGMGGGQGGFPEMYNIIVNTNHPLISEKLIKMRKEEKKQDFASYLVNLAKLQHGMLKGKDLSKFIDSSLEFLQ